MAYNKITLNGETKIDLTQDTVTAEDVELGKTFHLSSGEIATGTHTTQLQEKTVTPTKSVQEVTPDASYDGLAKVNVNAIPSEYIVPSGTKSITSNGTHAVTEYANVEVNVAGEEPTLVTKEITENGTYNATDDNADGYSSVVVNIASSGGSGGEEVKSQTIVGNYTAAYNLFMEKFREGKLLDIYLKNTGEKIYMPCDVHNITLGSNAYTKSAGNNGFDQNSVFICTPKRSYPISGEYKRLETTTGIGTMLIDISFYDNAIWLELKNQYVSNNVLIFEVTGSFKLSDYTSQLEFTVRYFE